MQKEEHAVTQGRHHWLITCLVAVVAALATLLVVKDEPRLALAQSNGGSSSYVVGLVGPAFDNKVPVFIIDSKKQTIIVYEYHQMRRELWLRAARSFANDRELLDNTFPKNEATSVEDVQGLVREQYKGR